MTIEDDIKYSKARVLSQERVRVEDVSSVYLGDRDRWVVSFIVGYAEDDEVGSARDAARCALQLTTDDGRRDIVWRVYDREAEETFEFTQREIDY